MVCSRHIAIVGGSGSGKTWLAERLCAELTPQAARLSLDDFYRDLSHLNLAERDSVNFDDPSAIDWVSARTVLDALTRGETAQVPLYDFTTHTRRKKGRPFAPRSFVVWDGLWLLHPASMRDSFVLSVFMDCGESERLARRLDRDVRERGRTEESVRRQFLRQVQPMHERFVEPQRAAASIILSSPIAAEQVAGLCRKVLNLSSTCDMPLPTAL